MKVIMTIIFFGKSCVPFLGIFLERFKKSVKYKIIGFYQIYLYSLTILLYVIWLKGKIVENFGFLERRKMIKKVERFTVERQ